MQKVLLLILVLLLYNLGSEAQSRKITVPLAASVRGDAAVVDWYANLQEQENEIADEYKNSDELNLTKQKLLQRIHPLPSKNESGIRDVVDTPYLWQSFQGNAITQGVPNDNDIAVSNTGYLISVVNTNIFKYDLNKDSVLGTSSLSGFCSSLGNFYSKYDPKVMYDPDQNKFVVVFLAGFTHTTSSIIVAFSASDDPNGVWNFYQLPGNPLDDSLWTDFPMIALTNHELFITVNHLVDNETWQAGWKRTVIWQIRKSDGYSGDSLHTQLHYDINYDGKGIRNLCPVKGGSHLYGSDIYFLSQRNFDEVNDTFFLVHLTDTINAPTQQLTVQALISPESYFIPVNAKQPYPTDLATNDSRVLGAFYENDRIQFCGNTTDTLYGTSAVYHGSITDVGTAPAISLHIISIDTLCYGYPNLSYAGNSSGDNTAIINVLRSAVNVNPGYSAFVSDGNGSYSALKNVEDGLSYHYYLNGLQRWGDYTGSQRDYSSAGKVWVSGSYATATHKVSTWICELGLQPPPASVPPVDSIPQLVNVYPNPADEQMFIRFEVPAYYFCSFDLYDVNGRFVKKLMEENVKPGENIFSFSITPLAAGDYFLRITSGDKVLSVNKVVKQ